jgi:hypothetical protein
VQSIVTFFGKEILRTRAKKVNVPFETRLLRPTSTFRTQRAIIATTELCRRPMKMLIVTIRSSFLNGDIMFDARSKRRRPKQGLYWLKLLIELLLRGANVQRGAKKALQAVMYISIKNQPVSSSIIVTVIINSLLSLISPFYLAPRIIDAMFGCQFGPRRG